MLDMYGPLINLTVVNECVPRAEDVSAVTAVVAPFGETKSDAAFSARFRCIVLEPVVGDRTSGYVVNAPRMHSTSCIANENRPMIPFSLVKNG